MAMLPYFLNRKKNWGLNSIIADTDIILIFSVTETPEEVLDVISQSPPFEFKILQLFGGLAIPTSVIIFTLKRSLKIRSMQFVNFRLKFR